MEQKAPSWVFPTVKVLVTLFYIVALIGLLVFTVSASIKLVNAQISLFSGGNEPPAYVSVPVAWGPANTQTIPSSQQPRIYLKPEKQTGQLQVPIRSTPGLLMTVLGLVGLVTAVWTFKLLQRIFQTAQTQSPFHTDNAQRITTMGLLFLSQTVIELLLKLGLWHQARPYFKQFQLDTSTYLSVDVNLDGPWLLGLILLALAQVYRRGIELQLDNELTI